MKRIIKHSNENIESVLEYFKGVERNEMRSTQHSNLSIKVARKYYKGQKAHSERLIKAIEDFDKGEEIQFYSKCLECNEENVIDLDEMLSILKEAPAIICKRKSGKFFIFEVCGRCLG